MNVRKQKQYGVPWENFVVQGGTWGTTRIEVTWAVQAVQSADHHCKSIGLSSKKVSSTAFHLLHLVFYLIICSDASDNMQKGLR